MTQPNVCVAAKEILLNRDEAEIIQTFNGLIGQKLSAARRAGDMRVLHFGAMRLAPQSNTPSLQDRPRGTVGDFALHIQCPWRIENDTSIITGQADLWEPLERSAGVSRQEWNYEDGNIQDERIFQLINGNRELVVESINVQSHGAFTLIFSCGYKLVVFPSGSTGEDWRFFRPGSDQSHLVVSGGAIEREES